MEKELALEKAKEWAENPFYDDDHKQEIQDLIDKNQTDELVDRFYKDLDFGTGGIRGIIGQGINRINKYTIMKATQALAKELKKLNKPILKVAISYDSRRYSFDFAKITASVLAGNNIHAYIYERLNPVCLLSFSVRHHSADAGVMVTASHNPPEYNGYKVYWDDGAQVIPPYDKNIINNYESIYDFSQIPCCNFDEGVEKGLIHWVGEDVENKYLEIIKNKAINSSLCQEKGKELLFVYTPINGTGLIPCTKAFDALGLTNYKVVEKQSKPDGNFPTVTSPNPENPEAMKMAVDLMKSINGDVAFASDPDADRIGVAVSHNDEVHYLTGNQIGCLLLHYIASNLKKQDKMPKNPYFVKTIVTSKLQDILAEQFGIEVINTLTGFKWICGKMRDYEQNSPEKNFLFGTEESFGYLNHDQVRDKDGIAPLTLLGEMALEYKLKGKTLIDALNDIYEEYGYSYETLLNINYYGKEGADKINRIMDYFRNYQDECLCEEKITVFEDYQEGYRQDLETKKRNKLDLPASNVLGFEFGSNIKLLLRPSGTEPKIKFYIMIRESEGTLEAKRIKALERAEKLLKFIKTKADKI